MGEEGLKAKKSQVEVAMEENEKPTPDSVLERFSVPSTSSIHYHEIRSWNNSNATTAAVDGIDLSSLPIFAEFSSIKSNFVHLVAMMDTSDVPTVSLRSCSILPALRI